MEPFIAAWKDAVMKNYANFAGRLSVGGYWRYFAVSIAIYVVLLVLALAASFFFILIVIFYLAIILPSIAAGVRRMHDIGKSGWFILVPIMSLIWSFQKGDVGDNAYGPPPVA